MNVFLFYIWSFRLYRRYHCDHSYWYKNIFEKYHWGSNWGPHDWCPDRRVPPRDTSWPVRPVWFESQKVTDIGVESDTAVSQTRLHHWLRPTLNEWTCAYKSKQYNIYMQLSTYLKNNRSSVHAIPFSVLFRNTQNPFFTGSVLIFWWLSP